MQGNGKMLNVLHVVPSMSPSWGGPAIVVSELTSELVRRGVGCEIVTSHGYRVGTGQVPTPDVPITSYATELPARLPVIITTGCEFPEVSERGAGLVIEADDAAVAEAMSRLLADENLRKRMGEQGNKLVNERYTWRATADTMVDLYKGLVS